ncbi:uncharacterized protein LOC121415809 [Lytechinus variegatus]|uniref:uncharacterized protein LOC121415809 n=1 Tax=Lytechinus variegatus TaxID=7654 RepID=UPI001BB1B74A|nr:uncharacterized protein LOC121415809 [Lytechinus variegatus]
MKARVVVIFVSCLVAGGVLALDSTEWQDGEWTTEPEYNISAIEPFSKPGYILPDLSISDIISTVGTMYQAEDLVHAIGSFCMEMRQLNWLTSGAMEELCLPILEALRNDSYAEAYSICRSSWSFVAELFGNEEDEYRDEGYPEGEYGMEGEDEVDHVPIRRKRWGFSIPQIELPPLPDIQNITLPLSPIQDILNITIPFSPIHDILNITVPFSPVNDLDLNWTNPIYDDTANVIGNIGLIPQFNRNWSFPLFDGTDFPFFNFPDQYEICSSLAGLISHDMPTYPDLDHGNIFGVVLKVIVAEHLKSIPGKCTSFLDDYEGSGDTGGDPLFDTDTDAMIDAFATLGGFDDIEQICNVSGWALIMTDQGNFELFNELVNQTTASIYSVITNRSRCIDFADSLHDTFDLGRGNFSHITSSDAFCDELFHYPFWRGNMSEIDFYLYENMDEKDGFIHLLFFIEMLSHKSDLGALEFLCRMSPYTDERFCTALAYNEYRDVSREEIIERCVRYTSFNSFEFDFLALVNAFGVELGFDFYDFGQTCSHLTDIIFNDEIKQRFTIRNVIQMGMKAFGRALAPMFCDLPSFRNGSLDSLEAPCEIPGRGCFNWTIPGNDFFLDRLDVGFITGTIFSFLGGYRDGDHVCHQMAFALENDTLLDMVAGRLEESIYRLFDNATFCSNTIDLITKLMGIDADIAPLIGFISTDSFCLEMSEIFHQERNYNFSFDSFLNLFVNEVDGGAHFVTSESIMYATAEMMKFAAMVIHSDTIGDAIYTSCLMWQGSGPFFLRHIFEVDEFCQAVLALDPGKLEHVCIYDLIPWLKYGLDHHDDEKEEEIDFDFGGLFETVGEEFGFDFSDSDQSCSHLNDILFNETVAQSYSIDSIVVKGIRIIGKTVSPIFCEFENLPETELEDPCMIPGQSCFNWSSRGEDYFHDREDIGFIIGTIFSYLGGYRDGDHLCHQMEFALHDDSQLDMVANKMKDSVFRFFSDQSFCSGTMGIISNLIGQDVDAATILGFENADSFCGNVNQIYNDNGDLPVNLEPLYVLFDSMDEYGEVDSHAIANATIEIIKFASMLLHSEDMGDALSRTCYVWQASAAMFNVSEFDDLCQMVIKSNADALYEVCTNELYPYIHWLEYGSDRPDEEKEEEIDFDFGGLLETVGEEFGFDFFDYDQSCSHLTDILFDEIVAQSYSIDSVVVKGIRIIGKTVSPIFCEFENLPETELEDPCITPGQNCFNWSSRGEDFFHDREDIGFIIGTIFSYLGGYRDGDHLCHQMEFALHDDSQLDMVANKMKDSVFRFFSDQSFCSGTMGIISNLIGQDVDAATILGFENADSFCGNVNQIYNDNLDLPVSLEPLYVLFDSMDEYGEVDSHAIANATIEIIKFASMLLHSEDMGDALSRTCHVWQASAAMFNVSEIDDLCQMVIESNADALYEVCTNELYPYIHWLEYGSDRPDEEKEEEIDFDFGGLLETVGEEFGFDFFDYDQSCSHLTDILFDEIVAQSYSIDSVVVKGIRIIGKTVSPIFCEFENLPETELEDPCITPGQNCFNWSSRGEDFFHDREDIGFIIGTIFSYLGGYRDGDHLCHQMEFALHDDSQLDMVANKMKDSVFRFFSDQSFCSGTMGIISNLIGQDMDAASILGFENADSFCGNVNQIYNDNGDLPVNLEPLYVLFDSMDEEGEVDSHSIANATIEIIKFAAMLLHSEDMGDALSRTCHVWQASSAMFNVSEIDDVCQMVIESNADALYEVCTDELYPHFIELFIEGGPHDVDPNRTAPIVDLVDLSNVEICLENGEVTFEGLEDLDILAYLMQITSKLYNVTEIDEDNICKGITNVIQSRKDIPTLITEFVVEWMTVFMPLGAELCSCWDQAFGYIFQETGDSGFGVDQLNEIVLIAVDSIGLASHHELCNDLIHLKPGNMTEYAEMIMEEILDFTANPEKCSCTVNRVIDFILPLVNVTMEEFHNYTYQFLGFESVEHVCSFVAESFSGVIVDPSEITCNDQQAPTTQRTTQPTTQPTVTTQASTKSSNDTVSEEEECFFIRDCAGVCNGDARYDCAGECGGSAELDCAFTCGGSATTNGCGWCVGGESGRPNDFGYECGSCKGESTATTVDCNNDCNGTAYRDACQVCVGGNTGVDEDFSASSLNCLGLCDDRYILNDCDECVPNTLGTIFSTKDCNHECKGLAIINECGYCVGGSTNRPADTGLTECGVCNTTSDPEFCFGCDGVAYSEATTDACDVCGGDGSTCFTVDSIAPSLIPADTDYQVKLRGAGFQDATTKQCKFLDSNGEQIDAVDISNEVGDEFNCTANLPAGTYSVYLSTESTELSEESVNLYVYQEITVNSISQSEFDIDDGETSISVNMVSTSGAFTAYKTLTTPKAIIYTETERIVIDGTFGGDNDDLLEFSGPMLTTSTQVTVYPSFNGIDSLANPDNAGFTITYYAPAPVVESLKFSSTGHLLELEFDVAINEDAVTSCDAIFMNTTTLGGEDAQCYAFPFLRVIYILPSSLDGGSLIEPDDELILRENILKKRDEEYARYASGTLTASSPDEAVSVIADLQGTEVISSCGNVRLSALRSRGSAGRSFTYQWSVSSDGSIPTELTDELTAAENYAFVSLAGSYLDPNTEYTFTITVENFLGGSDTDSLVVTRSDLNRPDVVIYPERVDISSALISQYFFLRASVRFSEACGGAEQMVYSWSVDDDSIALNLLTMSKPLLYVGAGTLPGDTDVTFTLEVSRESDPSTVTTQTVTVTTVYSDLVALIAGGSERTIGVDSGNFTLDGSSSSDPDNQNEEMAYLWTCEELNSDTGSYDPCVSSDTRELFPTEGESTASTLSLASNNLYSDSTYRFTLEITKLSRTASTSVTVIAKAGNPPQITVPEPLPDKIKSSSSHTLRVYVTHTSDITIEWATVDTDLGYGYVDFSQLSSQELLLQGETSPFFTTAYVAIPTGTLEAGYTYSFSVTVTDAEGQVSTSKIATTTYGGVSSCTLGIVDGSTSYQELDEITLVTQNCVTDAEAYPLTYQILHERAESSGTRYNALTGALAEASITIVGLTAFSNDQNTFAVKVCNDVGICSLYALTLDVTAIESFTQEQFEESIANLVDPQKLSGNFLDALVTFNTIASVGVSESRKRRAVAETSATAKEQLDLLQSAISSTVLDTASAQTLLDQSDSVVVAELTLADMDVYLDILIELVDVFSDEELPESSAETVLEKSSQIASELDPQYNSDMFAKIATLRNTLVKGQLSQIPLGAEPTETRAGSQTTRAFYAIPRDTLSTTSDNTSFSVKFGSEIENLYASWTCASGGTCSGVQIRFTQYDDDVDHYSTSAEDMANRASSILEIDLLDPSDSSELDITGLTSPISINMTATILQDDKVYDCYYWDSSNSSWSQDGLTTVYHSTVLSECQTTHLSAFTLISVDAPTTVPMPTTVEDDVASSTDSGATTTTEVSESGGESGLSTTGIIVIAVVIPVVLILIIVIAIVVIMSKKSSKIGSADVENTNSNGAGMGTSTAGGLVPVESANQAFSTPSHNPPTAPPAKPSHTVEVAAVPEPVAQDPIMDATSLPGSPEPPPEGPHIDTIIRDAQEGGGAQTTVDRAMTPVE